MELQSDEQLAVEGGEHNESNLTQDDAPPALVSLPSEILLEVLQYVVYYMWDQEKPHYLDLRRTCRTLDDATSRIVFQRIDRNLIVRNEKPLRSQTIKWLLLTKAKIQYNDTEGLFAAIHASAKWISSKDAFQSGFMYTYDNYLDAACRTIVAHHEGDWILQNAIFEDSWWQRNSPENSQRKPRSDYNDMGQDVAEIPASEISNGALHLTASLGNVQAVAILLTGGVNPNLSHPLYGYALNAAVFNGRTEVVRLFIKHGADLNVRPLSGEPPVVLAAQRNFKDIVDLLSEETRARVNSSCKNGLTALLWAARRGWLDTAQMILAREGVDPDPLTAWGDSPLAAAIKNRYDDLARSLIERLDIEFRSRSGVKGQLLAAVKRGSWEMVSLLLDRYKLDPNMHLRADKSLLGLAVFWRHKPLVEALLKRKDVDPNYRQKDTHPTPLILAIDSGDIKMVGLFLAHKRLNPNLISNGLTPLAKAIQRLDDQMAQAILRRVDVDVSARAPLLGDRRRMLSMLQLAALKGTYLTVRNLLDHARVGGPNENSEDCCSPLLAAITRGNTKVVGEILKQQDVDLNESSTTTRGVEAMTPLQHAIKRGKRKIVKQLLERRDLDVNKTGENSRTALELALLKEDAPRLTILLLKRADIDVNQRTEIIRNEYQGWSHKMSTELNQLKYNFKLVHVNGGGLGGGETVLLTNAKDGRLESVMQLMRNSRVDPNIEDAWKRTPLWWAAREGHAEVVERMIELGNIIRPSLVNVNAQDIEGWTPLLCAVNRGQDSIVSTLLKVPEIDPNLANQEGWTPLHLSVARENEKMVKQLLAHHKTNVWARLKVGRTALELTSPSQRRIYNAVKARENRDARGK